MQDSLWQVTVPVSDIHAREFNDGGRKKTRTDQEGLRSLMLVSRWQRFLIKANQRNQHVSDKK